MSCEEARDSLVEYLLDELDASSRIEIDAHLASGCRPCNDELRTLAEAMDVLWEAVAEQSLTPDQQREIFSRACSHANDDNSTISVASINEGKQKLRRPLRIGGLVAHPIAHALLAYAAGIVLMIVISSERTPENSVANLGTPQLPISLVMSKQQFERAHLVSMYQAANSSQLQGYILWDRLNRELHFFCRGLKRPGHGEQLALWLVGPTAQLRLVDKLQIDADGMCKEIVPWPEGDYRYARVTLEPSSQYNDTPSAIVELTSAEIQPLSF